MNLTREQQRREAEQYRLDLFGAFVVGCLIGGVVVLWLLSAAPMLDGLR